MLDTYNKSGQIGAWMLHKETTKWIRRYEELYRSIATDDELVLVQSMKGFKRAFFTKHRRQFDKEIGKIILKGFEMDNVSGQCRKAAEQLEKDLAVKGNPIRILIPEVQSPLRPIRWRNAFSDFCDYVGIPKDIKRLFMGKKDPANQSYEGKSRQFLEIFVTKLERELAVYSDPSPVPSKELQKLKAQLKTERLEKEEMKKRQDENN